MVHEPKIGTLTYGFIRHERLVIETENLGHVV